MKLRWTRQQAGMWVAFDEKGRSVGYVFHRGPGVWSGAANNSYYSGDSMGKAKAAVRAALEELT